MNTWINGEKTKKGLLTSSLLLLKPFTSERNLCHWQHFPTSFCLALMFLIGTTIVSSHLYLCLHTSPPRAIWSFPRWFHLSACPVMEVLGFLNVWPLQCSFLFRLSRLSSSMSCMKVCYLRQVFTSYFLRPSDVNNFRLKQLLMKFCILFLRPLVVLQVSIYRAIWAIYWNWRVIS